MQETLKIWSKKIGKMYHTLDLFNCIKSQKDMVKLIRFTLLFLKRIGKIRILLSQRIEF